MKWFQKTEKLRPELTQEILHNGKDMARFYTLTTEERSDVLNRIVPLNSPRELDEANKKDAPTGH